MNTIKEMVGPGQNVTFVYYRAKELWYQTDTGFLFPVPIADAGDATFLMKDKAILFMRYIRKYMEVMKEVASA
jgi:hypothetical protein